ncbi:MAG: 2-oxoglutarate oxidoreductase, partial [Candidatus Cloacimonetes bacterium]|nr:2-oxoglutarate oxidoreductase [Candidatus Cloacimonadota bacterium]
VFTYQGDGDLVAIGTAEIVHAANRGEHFSVFFVNNAIYGMTGGQMAPTSLPGMKTSTSPYGRDTDDVGFPIKVSELMSALEAPYYIERVSLLTPQDIIKAKKAVKKALLFNKEGRGFSMVEFLSTCPTNWGLDAIESLKWAKENMLPYFPLGVYRDKSVEEA